MLKSVLISGAGIAGPTLAWWLLDRGFAPTLVERAPSLRTAGHIVDFWGLGYEVAERMGLLPTLRALGYVNDRALFVRADGSRASGFGSELFRRSLGDRFMSLQRGDLARTIFERVDGRIETLFGDEIVGLHQDAGGVDAVLARAGRRRFDIVIGADGLHSAVRRLVFGEISERWLGYHVAAFETDGYPRRDEGVYVSWAAPGRQISRFALSGGRTGFLFVVAADAPLTALTGPIEQQKAALAAIFDRRAWIEWPDIRRRLMDTRELYVDVVSQIALPAWSDGRIALVGDAAYCPSLLAGEGSSLAMAGAYLLAGEVAARGSDHGAAFAAYETRFRPFIDAKQRSARAFASSFTPRTRPGLALRDLFLRATAIPAVGDLLMARFVRDDFDLPDYSVARADQS